MTSPSSPSSYATLSFQVGSETLIAWGRISGIDRPTGICVSWAATDGMIASCSVGKVGAGQHGLSAPAARAPYARGGRRRRSVERGLKEVRPTRGGSDGLTRAREGVRATTCDAGPPRVNPQGSLGSYSRESTTGAGGGEGEGRRAKGGRSQCPSGVRVTQRRPADASNRPLASIRSRSTDKGGA